MMVKVICEKMVPKGEEGNQVASVKSTQNDVLGFIAETYLSSVKPSTPDEFQTFLVFMEKMKVIFVKADLGSLLITVKCNSLQILEDLWKEYRSGRLGEMVQSCFATEYVLNKFQLSVLRLRTTIKDEDYEACKQHFMLISGQLNHFGVNLTCESKLSIFATLVMKRARHTHTEGDMRIINKQNKRYRVPC